MRQKHINKEIYTLSHKHKTLKQSRDNHNAIINPTVEI